MKNLGTFSRYTPESPPVPGAAYIKNADDTDWYSISWDSERTAGNIYAGTDGEGDIVCVTDDGSAMFPVDMTVWEIPADEAPDNILTEGYQAKIIDGVYILDHVTIAEGTQRRLLKEADDTIRYLERAVRNNIATEEEKLRLEAWEKYSVLVYRVNPDKPEWPVKPGEETTPTQIIAKKRTTKAVRR
ncbi:TPA: tail fiber assembly protein [Enterobacter ludwigii]|nr:tail fiber assembly protein [Enterobacter ludwigii]HDR2591083.1 tail fiber assembly protein [Enterobacter ludwigii]HDR2598722.1 tail fiber assembly protein [Enterobacter ludwigii]